MSTPFPAPTASHSSPETMALLAGRRRHCLLLLLLRNPNPIRHFSSSPPNPDPNPDLLANPNPSPIRTPPDAAFAGWVSRLRPGFSGDDLAAAIRSEADPDLALALFRWASLLPGFRHTSSSYLAALSSALSSRRFSAAESLVSDHLLAGACPDPDLPLLNCALRFCCSRRHLFALAFDLFKKMQSSGAAASSRPNLETYSLLLAAVLRRMRRPPASLVYLHAVRSLSRQMKASGVVPDTFALNLIIKAYSRCLEIDEALRVFREMPLYGCEPNELTYGYLVKGLFEKGRTNRGLEFFREMRDNGFVPTGTVYMAAVSALALERRFDESARVLFDMLDNRRVPDKLTYQTLLEEMCRDGRTEEAFALLEELAGRKRGAMDRRMYSDLLDGLHWICQPLDRPGPECRS